MPAHHHDRRSQQIIAFRELVNRHFREHLSLNDYASRLGITVVTLGRLCHEAAGNDADDHAERPADPRGQARGGHSSQSIKQIAHGMAISMSDRFS